MRSILVKKASEEDLEPLAQELNNASKEFFSVSSDLLKVAANAEKFATVAKLLSDPTAIDLPISSKTFDRLERFLTLLRKETHSCSRFYERLDRLERIWSARHFSDPASSKLMALMQAVASHESTLETALGNLEPMVDLFSGLKGGNSSQKDELQKLLPTLGGYLGQVGNLVDNRSRHVGVFYNQFLELLPGSLLARKRVEMVSIQQASE